MKVKSHLPLPENAAIIPSQNINSNLRLESMNKSVDLKSKEYYDKIMQRAKQAERLS